MSQAKGGAGHTGAHSEQAVRPPPPTDGTWLRDGVAGKLPARRAVAQHPPFSPGNGGRGLQAALEEDISVVLRLLVCSSL